MSAASESLQIALVQECLRVVQARWIDTQGCPQEWASVTSEPNATGIVELRSALSSVRQVVRTELETTEKLDVVATKQSEAIS